MIPTIPLRPRNRLAELILAAVHDGSARAELRRIADATSLPADWLAENESRHAAALVARARAAVAALDGEPLRRRQPTLEETLDVAATLFDAGLGFEVHEILEPHWVASGGAMREALQGLIQIAVGYQHFANGNLTGARSLLDEGSARLRSGAIPTLDLAGFARDVRADLANARAGLGSASPAPPRFPRLTRAA